MSSSAYNVFQDSTDPAVEATLAAPLMGPAPQLAAAPGDAEVVTQGRTVAGLVCKKMVVDLSSRRTLLMLLAASALGAALTARGNCEGAVNCPIVPWSWYEVLAPAPQSLHQLFESRAETWFAVFHPVLLLFAEIPVIGKVFDITEVPHVLPVWTPDAHEPSHVHERPHEHEPHSSQQTKRMTFWLMVLFAKLCFLVLSTSVWYGIFIVAWPWKRQMRKQDEEGLEKSHSMLLRLFYGYHVTHHLFLLFVINVALVGGYVALGFGLDWEGYDLWVDCVIAVLNVTSCVTYVKNRGKPLANPVVSVALTLMPGIGSDIMLVKEFVFAATCFAVAQIEKQVDVPSTVRIWLGNTLGLLTILLSLCLFQDMMKDTGALRGFLQSHWPMALAQRRDGLGFFSTPWWCMQALQQTTIAKSIQAEKQNLPQLFVELLFVVAFGLHKFAIFALCSTVGKLLVIRVGRSRVANYISDSIIHDKLDFQHGRLLLMTFASMNGFEAVFRNNRNVLQVAVEEHCEDIIKGLCSVLDIGEVHVKRDVDGCTLYLMRVVMISRGGLAKLQGIRIKSLGIGDWNSVGAEGCKELAALQGLTSLGIGDDNSVGAEGCKELAALQGLTSLVIGGGNNNVDAAAEAELLAALPTCSVVVHA